MKGKNKIQSNPNSSNTDGSITMANSNLLLSPYEILPIDQENKIFKEVFLLYYEIVCCVYSLESPLRGAFLMSTHNIQLLWRRSTDFPELAIFASRTGAMINLHWLELPMARTIFHGPKGVLAIEVQFNYLYHSKGAANLRKHHV